MNQKETRRAAPAKQFDSNLYKTIISTSTAGKEAKTTANQKLILKVQKPVEATL
jgi:hypothetical protein